MRAMDDGNSSINKNNSCGILSYFQNVWSNIRCFIITNKKKNYINIKISNLDFSVPNGK